jgi:hydrogenase expression/formation protein HypC
MCLAVPGKVIEIYGGQGLRMCKVDFGGVMREACLEAAPEVKLGEYVIVHAGFVLNVLSEEEAQATLTALRELVSLEEELNTSSGD